MFFINVQKANIIAFKKTIFFDTNSVCEKQPLTCLTFPTSFHAGLCPNCQTFLILLELLTLLKRASCQISYVLDENQVLQYYKGRGGGGGV